MEQNNLISYALSNHFSERNDYDQRQPSASNTTNYYTELNLQRGISPTEYLSLPFHNAKSSYILQQPGCNSETNFADPSQPLSSSHENASCTEECTCDSDSDEPFTYNKFEDREILEEIVNELYEEIIIEHCLQVHQAVKVGAFIFDDEKEATILEPGDTLMSNSVTCPNCKKEHGLKDFKGKLGTCMNLTTRKSNRKTKPQTTAVNTGIDNSSSNGRKSTGKKRKQQSKREASKNAKLNLQQGGFDIYPEEYCGHVTKTGNRCMKKPNCSKHKPQAKAKVPVASFSDRPPQSFTKESESTEIDVDTVEPTPYSWPLSSSNHTAANEYSESFELHFIPLVSTSEENGKIKMTIKSISQVSGQQSKKKKKSKQESYFSNSFSST